MRLLRAALPHLRMTRANASGATPSTPSTTTTTTATTPAATTTIAPTTGMGAGVEKSMTQVQAILPPTAGRACEGSETGALFGVTWHPTGDRGSPVEALWPRGTWDDPVPITSSTHERVVACTGVSPAAAAAAGVLHPTTWITVGTGRPCQCPDCGQVFKLERRNVYPRLVEQSHDVIGAHESA